MKPALDLTFLYIKVHMNFCNNLLHDLPRNTIRVQLKTDFYELFCVQNVKPKYSSLQV